MTELILMDVNEKATNPSIYKRMIASFGSEKVRVVPLQCDYSIPLATGLLMVERKTVNDLLGSIADGRVFEQAHRMVEASSFCSIIVHGSLRYMGDDFVMVDGRLTRWRGRSVRSAIRSIQFSGCSIEFCPGDEFILMLNELIDFCSKPDHIHSERKRSITFKDVLMSDKDRETYKSVEFIASLPGIGRKKAEALMEHIAPKGQKYGTVVDALSLITQMGVTVPFDPAISRHWGQATVERIRKFLGLEDSNLYMMSHDKRLTVPIKKTNTSIIKKGKSK